MDKQISSLLDALRVGVDVDDGGAVYQRLFEHWLSQEHWLLAVQAVPLLVGIAPGEWRDYVAGHGLEHSADQFATRLAEDLRLGRDDSVALSDLRAWIQQRGVTLPAAFARVSDYISQVVPTAPADNAAQLADSAERELVLGAALALVTRFPELCCDDNGFFDGPRVAEAILSKGARWFPLSAPRMTRDEIAVLLETYLS